MYVTCIFPCISINFLKREDYNIIIIIITLQSISYVHMYLAHCHFVIRDRTWRNVFNSVVHKQILINIFYKF
jgi:hypothetical protein